MDTSKEHMIDHLVGQIETQLGWGSGENWSNKDFEELSERILEHTKKRLSVTTLKRIWGRAERIANPSSVTLDILSEFVGYENWRHYVNTGKVPETVASTEKSTRKLGYPIVIGLLALAVAVLTFCWPTIPKESEEPITVETIHADAFSFTSRAVSKNIPNSVVFEYNAAAAADGALIEIQQDWDNRKRITVQKEDSIATSIYYHPGFFNAKLVVDSTIVKEHTVFIQTKGWLGTLEQDSIPMYLDVADIKNEDRIAISAEQVADYHLDPRTTEVKASMYLVQDFGEFYTDDFQLSLQLQNTFENGVTGCRWAKLFVLYDGGAIGIPFAKKGCSANLDIMAFGEYIEGKKNDLSGLGVDFTDFVTFNCTAKDGTFQIMVNGQTAFEMETKGMTEKIRGVAIHFEGAGTIKDVQLGSSKALVYTSKTTG